METSKNVAVHVQTSEIMTRFWLSQRPRDGPAALFGRTPGLGSSSHTYLANSSFGISKFAVTLQRLEIGFEILLLFKMRCTLRNSI